jgi:hypothetical protein
MAMLLSYNCCAWWAMQQAPKAVKLDVPAPQYSHACNKVGMRKIACHRVVELTLHGCCQPGQRNVNLVPYAGVRSA